MSWIDAILARIAGRAAGAPAAGLTRDDTPGNVERFTGLADRYDRFRPSLPPALAELLTQLAGGSRPGLVVDLGCGTGLSTRLWSGKAGAVVGIEPNADMRRRAEEVSAAADLGDISYREGSSTRTCVGDGAADIVTCCHAIHWMHPAATFAEIGRILRPGGVVAVCDGGVRPAMHWQADAALKALRDQVRRLERRHRISGGSRRWPWKQHLRHLRDRRLFRFHREIHLHHVEPGGADRLIGLALSMSSVPALLAAGVSEEQIGLTDLRAAAGVLGEALAPWFFDFRVHVAVK